MFRRYATLVVRYRIAVIVAAIAVSCLFATRIGNLRVIVDPDANLPQDHPYVTTTQEIEPIFGGRNLVVIGIESASGTVFDPAILDKIQRVTDRVLEIPGVIRSNVISLAARKAKNIIGTEDGMVVRPMMEAVPRTPEEIARLKEA